MTDDNKQPSKAALHPVYTVSNIQHKVRILDGVKVSYASWVSLFTLHARGYKVLSHIDGTAAPPETDPTYGDWCEIDAHVLQWIYGTLSDDLLPRVLQDPSTAYEAWQRVEAIFRNNKGARAATLEHEFNNLQLENMPSLDAYCQRLRDLATQLKGVGADIDDARLVRQMVRGLPADYDVVAAYINQTMPSFETAHDMLDLEQNRKRAREGAPTALTVAAAPDNSWGDNSAPAATQTMATTTTTAAETALYDDDDDTSHYCRARLYISCLTTVALSSVILWGLVTISDPKAELLNLKLRNVNANYSVIDIELQLTNRNYFRGFNYTDSGWIDIFYISEETWNRMNNYTYTQPEYQGFRKALNWNFSVAISSIRAKKLMKTQESHVYVSLVLGYWDKILFWSSDTFDRQWLDAHVYLNNDSFDLKKGVKFNRTQDFTMALAL